MRHLPLISDYSTIQDWSSPQFRGRNEVTPWPFFHPSWLKIHLPDRSERSEICHRQNFQTLFLFARQHPHFSPTTYFGVQGSMTSLEFPGKNSNDVIVLPLQHLNHPPLPFLPCLSLFKYVLIMSNRYTQLPCAVLSTPGGQCLRWCDFLTF